VDKNRNRMRGNGSVNAEHHEGQRVAALLQLLFLPPSFFATEAGSAKLKRTLAAA